MKEIDALRSKFITGTLHPDEKAEFFKWLKNNPDQKEPLFREKDLYQFTHVNSETLNRKELEEWSKLQKRITTGDNKKYIFSNPSFKRILQIAAIVLISLLTGWVANSFNQFLQLRYADQFDRVIKAPKGQITEVFLADGTHVWLNSESCLKFPTNFSSDNRSVKLNGEAYFHVQSDEDHPFYVKSGQHQIKVTGTKFNVKKYPEDHKIETVLEEGKVKILGGNIIRDLLPGQRSSFNIETMTVKIDQVDFDIYTSWRDGRFEFKNEKFDKVMKIIERWWDVDVVYNDPRLDKFTFSGVLKKHKDVDYIFEIINSFIPIDYQISHNQIIIQVK